MDGVDLIFFGGIAFFLLWWISIIAGKNAIKNKLQQDGFKIDKFYGRGKGFIALDFTSKKVAIGYSSNGIRILNLHDVVEWRTNGVNNHWTDVELVVKDVKYPTHSARLKPSEAKECYDTLTVAINH